MNYIRIYMALPEELSVESTEFKDYIRSLNDLYYERGIFFEVKLSADYDNDSISEEKNQKEDIEKSDYFYIIFGRRDDSDIRSKFDIAWDAFQENNNPKIYTYFKELPEGVEAELGVRDFIDKLDQTLGHYYSQFVHVDTIKLDILREIVKAVDCGDKLEFEDGFVTLNGADVLPLDNIPMYKFNENLQKLKSEKEQLDEEFYEICVRGKDDPEARIERNQLDKKRIKVNEQIHEMEKNLLNLYSEISDMRHSGEELSPRVVEAGRLLDIGNYEGAKEILRDSERKGELRQAEYNIDKGNELRDNALDRIRQYIRANCLLISTLSEEGEEGDNFNKICDLYEENTRLAQKYLIELDCIYNHMKFLYEHKEYSQAITLGEWLKNEDSYEEDADFLNLLGQCFLNNKDL